MTKGSIQGINGPVIEVSGASAFFMQEMVYVGNEQLIGEVIGVADDIATVQVYEDTQGLKIGEDVINSGSPMCVTLAPGIISNIFDGIQRPLHDIKDAYGAFIKKGASFDALDKKKKMANKIHKKSRR